MFIVISAFVVEGLLCSALGMRNASADVCEIVSLLLMQVNAILLCSYVANRYREYSRKVIFALILSVILKVFLILWDYYGTSIFILPNSHADSESYHWGAIAFVRTFSAKIENYSYVVGGIYYLFGVQRMTAQFFNVILSFLGISILEKCLCEFDFQKESKEYTLILAALLPNYLIMSSVLIRECLISVIISLSLYFYIKWWKNGRTAYFVLSFLIVLGACYFHSGAIAAAIGISMSLALTVESHDKRYRRLNLSFKTILLTAALFVLFMFLFSALSNSLLKRFGGLETSRIDTYIDEHNIYDSKTDDNGYADMEEEDDSSSYTAGIAGYGGWQGVIINSPIRIVYFLWVPMPWDMRGIGDLIAFFGSSLFYGGTFFRAVRYWFKQNAYNDKKALLVSVTLIAFSAALVFSWGVDSAGSALRHREKFYYIFLLLYCLVYEWSHFTYEISSVQEMSAVGQTPYMTSNL